MARVKDDDYLIEEVVIPLQSVTHLCDVIERNRYQTSILISVPDNVISVSLALGSIAEEESYFARMGSMGDHFSRDSGYYLVRDHNDLGRRRGVCDCHSPHCWD